jgi:hypothetical protein
MLRHLFLVHPLETGAVFILRAAPLDFYLTWWFSKFQQKGGNNVMWHRRRNVIHVKLSIIQGQTYHFFPVIFSRFNQDDNKETMWCSRKKKNLIFFFYYSMNHIGIINRFKVDCWFDNLFFWKGWWWIREKLLIFLNHVVIFWIVVISVWFRVSRESFNAQRESEIIMFNKFENYSNFLPPANNFVLQTNR